jgi:hypothetical protein
MKCEQGQPQKQLFNALPQQHPPCLSARPPLKPPLHPVSHGRAPHRARTKIGRVGGAPGGGVGEVDLSVGEWGDREEEQKNGDFGFRASHRRERKVFVSLSVPPPPSPPARCLSPLSPEPHRRPVHRPGGPPCPSPGLGRRSKTRGGGRRRSPRPPARSRGGRPPRSWRSLRPCRRRERRPCRRRSGRPTGREGRGETGGGGGGGGV